MPDSTHHAFFGLQVVLPTTFENRSVVLFVAPRIALMSARTPNVAPLTVAITPPVASRCATAEAALAEHVASVGTLSKTFKTGELETRDGLATVECSEVTTERLPIRMVCGVRLAGGKVTMITVTSPEELFAGQRAEMYRIVRSVEPERGTTP